MAYSQAYSSEHRIKKEEQGSPLFLTLRKPIPHRRDQWSTLPKFVSLFRTPLKIRACNSCTTCKTTSGNEGTVSAGSVSTISTDCSCSRGRRPRLLNDLNPRPVCRPGHTSVVRGDAGNRSGPRRQ